MTDLEIQVIGVIRHYNKSNPISVPKLTNIINWSNEDNFTGVIVRQAVRSLIMEHGELIGSTTKKPSGYYLITDPEEIEEQYQKFLSQGLKILARGAKLKKVGLPLLLGQLSLELEAEGKHQGVLWCKL